MAQEDAAGGNERQRSRREFLRTVGATVFSVALVDVADPAMVADVAFAQSGCSTVTPDAACSASNTDEHCGYAKPGGGVDKDESCSTSANDESCQSANTGEVDESCSTSNADDNCGRPYNGDTKYSDVDESCQAVNTDENCQIQQVPKPQHDADQHCTATGGDADASCGDCDDTHESDEHCGKPLAGGATDPDDMCGHQHWVTHHEDQVCSATQADVGCGIHTTVYGGTDTDPDQHCTGTNADMNCTGKASDANCTPYPNPSTTTPDEGCNTTGDVDSACGHYDADESCGGAATDEACGLHFGVIGSNTDTDENCTAHGGTNATDNTGVKHVTK